MLIQVLIPCKNIWTIRFDLFCADHYLFVLIFQVTLGLVLIFIGPMLSQKVHPPVEGNQLMINNGSARQVRANVLDGDATDKENELLKDTMQLFTEDLHSNDTNANSTLEVLGNPEALSGGYLAYVPFQEEVEEDPEEYFDYSTRQWRIKADQRKPAIVPLMVLPIDTERIEVGMKTSTEDLQTGDFGNDQLPSDSVRKVTIPLEPQLERRKIPGFRREEQQIRVVSSKFPARKRPPSLLHPPPRQRAQESASESKRLNPFSRFRLPDSVRRSASRNNEQYPANPLSIRDIIDYMTIAENEERNNRFFNSRIPQSSAQRPRNSNRPRTRFDRIQEEKKRSQSRRKTEPYSFLLDVYPYRNGGEVRTPEEFNSNRHPVTEAPSHQVDFQPETTTHTFWDLNSGDLSGYRVQYQDSNQLRYPSIGTIPPGVLPLETTTHFDSLRPSTESSSRQNEKQVIIHLNVYSEKSTDALGSRYTSWYISFIFFISFYCSINDSLKSGQANFTRFWGRIRTFAIGTHEASILKIDY